MSTININRLIQERGPFGPLLDTEPPGLTFQTALRDCDNRAQSGRYDNEWYGDPHRDPLTVSGNTVNTGRYTIAASTDGGGTLTVTDNTDGESFKVWGDPHITTDKGDTTSFQHAPATFQLPDGTEITVDPTHNSGVNYIDNVTITKGNDAVAMTDCHGNLQIKALPGEGHYLDGTTPDGTVLTAKNGNIDQLQLPDGSPISGGNVANIDGYANDVASPEQPNEQNTQLGQEIAVLEQEIEQLEQSLNSTGFMSHPLQASGTVSAGRSQGPSGWSGPTPTSGPTPASLLGRINQAMQYFMSQGWTRAQAAGIVANLQAESGLNSGIQQLGGGPGYGLAQWEGPRQADFARWAGLDIHGSSFGEQLQFVQYELTRTQSPAGNALQGAQNAADAGALVCRLYERPADIAGQSQYRAGLAQQIYASSGLGV